MELASSLLDRMEAALLDVSDVLNRATRMEAYTTAGVDFRGVTLAEIDGNDLKALSSELLRRLDGS